MTATIDDLVRSVLRAFDGARHAVRDTLTLGSARAVTAAVVAGEIPQEGDLADGAEYYWHGIGYTVVLAGGGQIHVDAAPSGDADLVTVHDIHWFLESSGMPAPSVDALDAACIRMCEEGLLDRIAEGKYMFLSALGVDAPVRRGVRAGWARSRMKAAIVRWGSGHSASAAPFPGSWPRSLVGDSSGNWLGLLSLFVGRRCRLGCLFPADHCIPE